MSTAISPRRRVRPMSLFMKVNVLKFGGKTVSQIAKTLDCPRSIVAQKQMDLRNAVRVYPADYIAMGEAIDGRNLTDKEIAATIRGFLSGEF